MFMYIYIEIWIICDISLTKKFSYLGIVTPNPYHSASVAAPKPPLDTAVYIRPGSNVAEKTAVDNPSQQQNNPQNI